MESLDEKWYPKEKKKKYTQQKLKERYESGDPQVELLGEPSGNKFEYYVLCTSKATPKTHDTEKVQLNYMFGLQLPKIHFHHKILDKETRSIHGK